MKVDSEELCKACDSDLHPMAFSPNHWRRAECELDAAMSAWRIQTLLLLSRRHVRVGDGLA